MKKFLKTIVIIKGEILYLKNLEEEKKLWIKVSVKKGLSIPEPVSEDEFSGRFLLRIPAKLAL